MWKALSRIQAISALMVFTCAAKVTFAATISLSASKSGKGLAEAVAKAKTGDTLHLGPGIYRERLRIDKSISIRGASGTIIDGAMPLAGEWTQVEDLSRVFVMDLERKPNGLLVDGKFIASIRYDRALEKGDWHWQTLFAKGTPLSGFEQICALWMYHPKEKRIYLRLESGAAPNPAKVTVVLSSDALIAVGAKGVEIEGITFRGGRDAIRLGEGASECVVRKCMIMSFEDTGILITGGASRCTVEDCRITRGALEEWRPTNDKRRENYEIWRIHKDVGNYDRVGINLIRAGEDNRIVRNHLDRTFDGICIGDSSAESLDKALPDPNHGRGTEIAENVIENTRDSGIELGVGCIQVNVHHNILRHTHGGLRFKLPRIGPVFIHHNHLVDGTPFNIWFSMDASPAEGFVYHNTIEGGDDAALLYSSFNARRDFATPRWHFLNNLVLNVRDGFFAQNKNTPARDFTETHNVVTNDAKTAVDAGVDLSTYFHGKALPGCENGYFKGSAPDAGVSESR
ncbi:MAG: right-handed parallel beta-helix repeat-containing protein [Verrucomicrobiaceae bacterium]|nr:right-handed parallel beta-helix repeat-containing protein [Verrucomicrobiaceae bacterium]